MGGNRRPWRARATKASLAVVAALLLVTLCAVILDRRYPPNLEKLAAPSIVVADSGNAILRAFTTHDGKWRLPARAADVDPRYLKMLVAYEDRRFDLHPGVDPLAALRAAGQYATSGRIVSGASTLSMQAARLLDRPPRTLWGKLRQSARAVQLEAHVGKDGVLAAYLTVAPFGGNLEGVRAASLAYFGKEPRRLTTGEAALLVALPQSPERLRPDRRPDAARLGRDKVLARLADAGVITGQEAEEARAEPIPGARLPFPFAAPHLAQRLARQAANGAVIATTIDGGLQRRLEELAAREAVWIGDGGSLAVIVLENRERRLRAYVGNARFDGPAGQIDLARARRSPGSALKPFIYAMAFDDRIIHPATLIDDEPSRFGDYAPRNFDRGFLGTVTVREALRQSLNVPAVALLDRVGPVRFIETLKLGGARPTFPRLVGAPTLPVALGGLGMTLFDMTQLFAALADGGIARPITVTSPVDTPPTRLVSEAAAWYVTDILRQSPLPEGWAQGRGIERQRNLAFKTGTSFGFRDAWAVGYSPSWTVGIWSGRADGSPRPGHFGRNTATPLLLKVFDALPSETEIPRPAPPEVVSAATNTALPETLRHFRSDQDALLAAARKVPPLRILFPPDGAVLERTTGANAAGIPLRAEGGRGPLHWVINGSPMRARSFAADTFWQPDGDGFTRIAVIDGEGRSAAVRVRIDPPRPD